MRLIELIDKVFSEVSGNLAKDFIAEISRFHRIQASPGFHEAALFVRDTLAELGYEPVLHEFPADGRNVYLDGWRAPIGWEVVKAELRVVKPKRILLGKYPDLPTLVVAHSASRPEGVEAELVDVGTGMLDEEYKVDVEGKFVLASGRARIVHEKAVVERGAIGIIVYNEKLDAPNAIPYTALWPTADELNKVGLAFAISYRQALRLKSLLKQRGSLTLYGMVESRFFQSHLEVVEATTPGEVDRYVLLIAHLCHPKPGAHDNASGSGTLLEIARALQELLNKGFKLNLGIKFLWVPEFYGTIAYIDSHEEFVEKFKAVINLDMVGASQEKTGGTLTVVGIAPFNPTFLPLLAYYSLKECAKPLKYYSGHEVLPPIKYNLVPYIGGSDHHVFVDPVWGIPATAYIEWPDKYYHTSLDVIDNLDPRVLKVVGSAALSLALYIANFDDRTLTESTYICKAVAKRYLEEKFLELLKSEYEYANLRLKYLGKWMRKAIESLKVFAKDPNEEELIKNTAKELQESIASVALDLVRLKDHELIKTGEVKKIEDKRVLKRTKRCPLYLSDVLRRLPRTEREYFNNILFVKRIRLGHDIVYFLFDGRRSVSDVFEEYYAYYKDVDVEVFIKLVDALVKTGWLEEVTHHNV